MKRIPTQRTRSGRPSRRNRGRQSVDPKRLLANRIAADVFMIVVDGRSTTADQLRLWSREYGQRGGWSQAPLAERIFQHLTGAIK